ncbi:MAG: 3-phosphoshikimate 1-carboxyvinyltransferase [Thermoflavifilum sp.]|nr:3-phosphoshikimate 1-carboxyvinyltransferase [Thermoflavifilum sp.]MCL6514398.1 3-phosphoshikimate 1-carboxyvinyltransferase [Alicyclobacillus sp.]
MPDLEARSPWATLTGVRAVHVAPLRTPPNLALRVPGSKSFTNRALLLAGAAEGRSRLRGILRSDDSYWCIDALRRLGCDIRVDGDSVEVDGCGAAWRQTRAELYIGAAGTTARFLPGLLATAATGEWQVRGSRRLSERPLGPLVDALSALGGRLQYLSPPAALPLRVWGGGLRGGRIEMSGKTSSQFISGVLMAAPRAQAPVEVVIRDEIVQAAYVSITTDLMAAFGAPVERLPGDRTAWRVLPQPYRAADLTLEADASTAGYFFALAAAHGGRTRIDNLKPDTLQPDIGLLDVLERMGCTVTRDASGCEVQGPRQLRGGFRVDMRPMSDQALTVGMLSVFADAPVTVTGVAHIRQHESDRIRALCESLARLGIRAEEHADGFTVYPGQPRAARLPSYDDHRVAMSLAVLGTRAEGVVIEDPGCVSKTCPTFFDLLQACGVQVSFESDEDGHTTA